MKMIRAIIRPDHESEVLGRLEAAGHYAMTKVSVLGRGQQRGIQVGAVSYDELAKVMLILVVEDGECEPVITLIEEAARTGHPGDGKVFLQHVTAAYTISTGKTGL